MIEQKIGLNWMGAKSCKVALYNSISRSASSMNTSSARAIPFGPSDRRKFYMHEHRLKHDAEK